MLSVDAKAASDQSGFEGALLVADTRSFIEAWRELLAGSGEWPADQVAALRERSKTLQSRARAAAVGGLAHHLAACDECAAAEQNDPDRLEECLMNVAALAWQLEQEGERSRAEPEPPAPKLVAPEPPAPEPPAPKNVAPEPPAPKLIAPEPPASKPVAAEPPAPKIVAPEPPASKPVAAEPPASKPVAAEPPASKPVAAEPPAPKPVAAEPPAPKVVAPEAVACDVMAPESALPGSSDSTPEPSSDLVGPPPLISSPPEGWDALPPAAEPIDAASQEAAQATAALSELLGLAPIGSRGPARVEGPFLPVREEAKPPQLGPGASGLPVLELHVGDDGELLEHDLTIRLDRVRRAVPYPLGRGLAKVERERAWQPWLGSWAKRSSKAIPWWAGPLAVGMLGGLAGLILLLGVGRQDPPAPVDGAPGALGATRNSLLPAPRLTDEAERLRGLLAQVHGHGRTESPELADLIDEEAALLAKAVTEPCTPGSVGCRLSEQARQLVKAEPLPKLSPRGRGAPGDWLSGLQLPDIGLKDDPRVQSIVKFHTENPVGREMFQVLLFQCGAHRDLFHESLTRRGLPLDLIALVMVESECILDAESPVGARGLWQFMPATARAYHLRVQAGVIDERLSATKATDAALRFLGDLYGKLGSWELALASYNMGPFGLLARLRQAGGDADYWDLVEAGRLPNETAKYVPKIEAFALILANLEHFRFEAAQQKSAEASVELSVPSGTRLGLVARAAASSTIKIRELNPELMGDTAPGRSGESFSLRVPREAAPRARETLERLIAQADDADECVPHGFDWGRQRFTRTMLTRCRR